MRATLLFRVVESLSLLFMKKKNGETHEMFRSKNKYYGPGSSVIIRRDNNFNEIIISLGNGGHIRLVSETPIKAFCKPE